MKTKEDLILKINEVSFKILAFLKNITSITKRVLEEKYISKEDYGEALFSMKLIKENIIKCETRIINLIEDYELTQNELKQALDIILYGRDIGKFAKRVIKILKKIKNEETISDENLKQIINIINIYDIFILECDIIKIDSKKNSNIEVDIEKLKNEIEYMVLNQDIENIKEKFFKLNDYFFNIIKKAYNNEKNEENEEDKE